MKNILFVFLIIFLISCNSIRIKMTSTSMEGTMKEGKTYWVLLSENVEHYDIVAFNYVDKNFGEQVWVFRVIGISGDSVQIKQGDVFVNGKIIDNIDNTKLSYSVKTTGRLNPKVIENMDYEEIQNNYFHFYLTEKERIKLQNNPVVSELKSEIYTSNFKQWGIYKSDSVNNWNRDNYGPVLIPKESEEILYFVLGDNRHNAMDSRYIGFIKESDIVGTVKQ